jgi:mono/diheme cytochrome c family protein
MEPRLSRTRTLRAARGGLALAVLAALAAPALAATPADQLAALNAAAGAPGRPANGQRFFTSTHGGEWSCASCHGQTPTAQGKHARTGKAISPLAPAFNDARFVDEAKSEKWFRRNCNDVVGRECTSAEKADVLAWLMSLKP